MCDGFYADFAGGWVVEAFGEELEDDYAGVFVEDEAGKVVGFRED